MTLPKEHFEIALERFEWAERAFDEEDYHTSGHLYINAVIKFNDFLCQKYLRRVFTRKPHQDLAFLPQLSKFLKHNYQEYKQAYAFLMSQKSIADYGVSISESLAKQIKRRAHKIKEIVEQHYNNQ